VLGSTSAIKRANNIITNKITFLFVNIFYLTIFEQFLDNTLKLTINIYVNKMYK